jgi:1-acyl-sn-glycerol-3-phosphate acyltransferase
VTGLTRRGFEWLARAAFRWYCHLEVTGRETLPPMPFILCSNHASHMDAIALMAATGQPFTRFGLLAASDYFFSNPIVHHGFSSLVQLIPIERRGGGSGLARTIALCREFLRPGARGLVMFPEGTRSISGEIGPFKRGVAMIASELGVPIVPAYIEGSASLMPKGRPFPFPGRVTVRLGTPVVTGPGGNSDELLARIEARVHALKQQADPEIARA